MTTPSFAERHPVIFSLLILFVFFFIISAGVAAAQIAKLPPTSFSLASEIALVVVLGIIVTAIRWWNEIGFRAPAKAGDLLLYAPALILFFGNLTFGIVVNALPAVLSWLVLAAASGFVEEVTFRGLILRAFRPRGAWTAVLVSTAFFGFIHAANVLAGSDPLYVVVQIAYALAIGFCFGALAYHGRLLWPLVVAHGLGNFAAFLNSGRTGGEGVNTQLLIVSGIYIVIFTAYGLWLMLRKSHE